MKVFFVNHTLTELADTGSAILFGISETILQQKGIEEANDPAKADIVLIQEETTTYKEFRYIDKLLHDPFLSNHLAKLFTICADDSSTGLLPGLYTSMPNFRVDRRFHRVVPFFKFSNPLVFAEQAPVEPTYLAGWYGNTKSNKIRRIIAEKFGTNEGFYIKTSNSWYNHKQDEQRAYVDLIKSSKFSLCPAGWAPSSPRIFESMAIGRCPVIIADHFAPPVGPEWEKFALFLPEKNIMKLPAFLQEYEPLYKQLGEKAKENWEKYFAGDLLKQYYVNTLLSLIRSTPSHTRETEIRRWRSFSTYWNNRWTMPQRVVNKWRSILEKRED